jgi:hypothetical protein
MLLSYLPAAYSDFPRIRRQFGLGSTMKAVDELGLRRGFPAKPFSAIF